jgi:hypothetical protein
VGRLVHKDGTEATVESVVALLTASRLTVNHNLKKAGARGSSVHKAAEDFAETGSIPNLSDYSREERGYVRAFCKFVIENEPVYEASEVIVGWAPLLPFDDETSGRRVVERRASPAPSTASPR